MTERISCNRCRMTFRCESLRDGGAYTICAEPNCGQRFWHKGDAHTHGKPRKSKARVGIDPKDAAKLREQNP